MTRFSASRRMPYSAGQLFAIVADVAAYADYVPLCNRSSVSDRKTLEDGRETFHGELDIAYAPLKIGETFVSEVTIDPARLTIRAVSDSGPVKALDSRWIFRELPAGGCEVQFTLEFTMASRILQAVMAGAFEIALKIMTAFEARAQALHG